MGNYSSGDVATLPTTTDDLEHVYDATDLSNVQTDDANYVEQTATNEYPIHQYKDTITAATANITWKGKTDQAPVTYPVYLQAYNTNTTSWVELDRNNSAAAGADFTLQELGLATANYKDGSNLMVCRIYQTVSGQVIIGGTNTSALPVSASTKYYHPFSCASDNTSNEANMGGSLVTTGGTISAFIVNVPIAPGAGITWTFTLMKNGSPTTVTAPIANTDLTVTVTGLSEALAAGDRLTMGCTSDGVAAGSYANWSVLFTPTTSGECNLFGSSGTGTLATTNGGAAEYISLSGNAFSTTLFNNQIIAPCTGTLKNLYVSLQTAPGGSATRTFTVMVGGDSTTITQTLSTTSGSDTAHTVDVTEGQLITVSSTVTGTGDAAASRVRLGLTFVGAAGTWIYASSAGANLTTTTAARYLPINGNAIPINSTAAFKAPTTTAFTAKALFVAMSGGADPGQYVVALSQQGTADANLAVTMSGTEVLDHTDYDLTIAGPTNDIQVKCTPSSSPTQRSMMYSVLCYKA